MSNLLYESAIIAVYYSKTSETIMFCYKDMGALEAVASYEKWFVYGAEQKQAVEEYISYSR